MRCGKTHIIIGLLMLFLVGCKSGDHVPQELPDKEESKEENKLPDYTGEAKGNYTINKYYDSPSATYYFLTRISHKDKDGKLIKLRLAHADKDGGETVRAFALRTNSTLAFNASTQREEGTGIRPQGVQVLGGKVVYDLTTTAWALGIKDDNELVAYAPTVKGDAILNGGVKNALTAFGPLIQNGITVSTDLMKLRGNYAEKNPRQVIAQLANKDILFLSCGGRGFDGEGMLATDVVRILHTHGVKFAYMLDGGGSTSTVVEGELVTKQIDGNGTRDRLRPNFLYFK